MSKTHIVWFKEDLRVHDHAPLAAACASGDPVLAVYVFEPEFWSGPDGTSHRLGFLRESLTELSAALEERGAQLVVRVGRAPDVFAQLHRDLGVAAIHAHREGRSGPEAKRNDAVRRWALRAGVSFREQESARALRPGKLPGDWQARWHDHIHAPRRRAPEFIFSASARSEDISSIQLSHLQESQGPGDLPGGRTHGVRLLRRAFVANDAQTFREVVSALKQHIAVGTVSIREVVQAARRAQRIGTPGLATTYAETLIERICDDCERQHRRDERAASRALGGAVFGTARPTASYPPSARDRVPGQSARRRAQVPLGDAQLSFDFPGAGAETRQAS